jgi:hypothetical protein
MGMRFAGTKTTPIHEQGSKYSYNFSGQAYLTNLIDGPHTITVYYGAVNRIDYVGTPQESIYYNRVWQATSQFYVQNKLTPSPAPTQTPNPISTTTLTGIVDNPLLIAGTVGIVAIAIGAGALIYFKKYHRK